MRWRQTSFRPHRSACRSRPPCRTAPTEAVWNSAPVSRSRRQRIAGRLGRPPCSWRMATASAARRQASELAAIAACRRASCAAARVTSRGRLRKPWYAAQCGLSFRKSQQLVGRHPQGLAHLVNQRQARLDLRSLVSRVAVLLDPERLGEVSRPRRTRAGSACSLALRELRTHFGSEHLAMTLAVSQIPHKNVIAVKWR